MLETRSSWIMKIILFFFFQAEVGIRAYKVTGVQTCALPISLPQLPHLRQTTPQPIPPIRQRHTKRRRRDICHHPVGRRRGIALEGGGRNRLNRHPSPGRSEERRVGTERGPQRWTEDSNVTYK